MITFGLLFGVLLGAQEVDYLNPELPIDQRVDDLVSRMTLEEKVSQMQDHAPAIPRLDIPEYNWWNEALHGVARAGTATVFPQAIGIAATWNTDLMAEIADVISTEARAKYHRAIENDNHGRYYGLTFWSPNINIFRDPRWGRGQETYGEDPYLTSRMGVEFVKGLQGDHPEYFKVIATPKHYVVHSGPEPLRHKFNATVNQRDLWDTYMPAFRATIQGAKAYSSMCAYNRTNGEACCGSNTLLKNILRNEWGFDGYIVSDCGAVEDIYNDHKMVKTAPEAAALAVQSGTDLNCGDVYEPALVQAVEQGLIAEETIDTSIKRLLRARMKLGMFDPPEMVPYTDITIDENDTPEHRELSRRAAQESIVLLKNSDDILPLGENIRKIAVIGPTADSYAMLVGNYNGTPSKYVTPLQGIKNKVPADVEVEYLRGSNPVRGGAVIHDFSNDLVSVEGKTGLYAEYFNNRNLKGEPFFTGTATINSYSWLWGESVPDLGRGEEFSVRWKATLTAPETGKMNFIVSGSDGYRLKIDGNTILSDWDENEVSTTEGAVQVVKGEEYEFVMEFFQATNWPRLSVQWQMLDANPIQEATELASESDVVIFVGGITAELEGEEMPIEVEGFRGGDRTSIQLPTVQQKLLKALHKTGTPVVLVQSSGSALASSWAKENIPTILHLWYPGQEGGTALADVLFGDYSPGGRLPVTFYKSVDQLPPFDEYSMENRTYRYFDGEPLYPFGYGLSYTTFDYSSLKVPSEGTTDDEVNITVDVTNTGDMAGDEVVQLYVKDLAATGPVPLQSLQGMKRVHLESGETRTVEFTLQPENLALVTENGQRIVEPGEFEIFVGGGLPDNFPETSEVTSGKVTLTGETNFVD
ncbi:MAG: glycoside hydrolase family 3 C-terminal domain-containing protein [Candidatus Marinimicrobia bacterium]|nr:glycoside hydrolase family 3 C-terminal domain-containing protein [Candidatus Neomarinimicrobiota bacterium]MCF7828712.1 glycoside hydrolase family 3 C-terminal domain-containing protein [Candidatus Neomarinimicrobiota bacterium]MCF7880453.1 glycoside hydrolase family 3 C-terminal domain-containing protein [Candidatus Neomarinimicrobiota bacterium]